jgi:hypothetical protein
MRGKPPFPAHKTGSNQFGNGRRARRSVIPATAAMRAIDGKHRRSVSTCRKQGDVDRYFDWPQRGQSVNRVMFKTRPSGVYDPSSRRLRCKINSKSRLDLARYRFVAWVANSARRH